MELLDGRRLLTQEARSLEGPQRQSRGAVPPSSHETGFIQYLDSGIWHLAFYNDGKESEVVSFLTTAIGKEPPPSGVCGVLSVCVRRCSGCWELRLTGGGGVSRPSCRCHLPSGIRPSDLWTDEGRGCQEGPEGHSGLGPDPRLLPTAFLVWSVVCCVHQKLHLKSWVGGGLTVTWEPWMTFHMEATFLFLKLLQRLHFFLLSPLVQLTDLLFGFLW